MTYEETPAPAKTKKAPVTKVKLPPSEIYNDAKEYHRLEIQRIKHEARVAIRKHKLLIQQAKNTYKLSKLEA